MRHMTMISAPLALWACAGAIAAQPAGALGGAATMTLAQASEEKPPLPTTNSMGDFWNNWSRNADIGFNGAEGNSDNLSIRGGIGATRLAQDMETKAGINYKYAQQDDEKSQSRGEAFVKNDYIWPDTKWGFWWQGRLEYDEFQAWDWRASFTVGPSYTFIKNERTLLRGRAGLGVSYEFGGEADEEPVFEGMLGLDWEHKINQRQKVFATVEYYPSISDFPEYRIFASAGWELLVDPESNMFLKLGAIDRYDSSTKAPRKKNDFEYFGMLSWIF